ncbi:MAG: hypothetical protein JWQ09_677 [Segetibacter sp.]|nr:hypothetical protein [Segetibacter sp.]
MAYKCVYFLGAGASKNFGYPLTGDITPLIMQKLLAHNLFQISRYKKTEDEKQQETDLLNYIFMVYPGLKSLDIKTNSKDIPSITEILSLVDHFHLHNLPIHSSIGEKKLSYFRNLNKK